MNYIPTEEKTNTVIIWAIGNRDELKQVDSLLIKIVNMLTRNFYSITKIKVSFFRHIATKKKIRERDPVFALATNILIIRFVIYFSSSYTMYTAFDFGKTFANTRCNAVFKHFLKAFLQPRISYRILTRKTQRSNNIYI